MHRNALAAKWKWAPDECGGVAMQLELHYWKCTTAKEYRVILAIQSLRHTINGNWLWTGQSWKFPWIRGKRDLFQPARRRRQTAMSGLVGNIQTHRQPKRIKANTAGSLKLGRLQIIVKYDAKPITHTPSPVYLFRFMISMLRPKSTSRRLCLSWPNIKGDQLILCPDLFANLLTASCPCRCSVAMLCWLMKFVVFRYQLFLQVKQDVLQGRLPVAFELAAELGAFVVQCE